MVIIAIFLMQGSDSCLDSINTTVSRVQRWGDTVKLYKNIFFRVCEGDMSPYPQRNYAL